jgi:hypothetical protein
MMTRTGLLIGVALALVLAAGAWAILHRPAPHELPPALAAKVEQHHAATAVDTMVIHDLERAADTARAKQRRDSTRARALERSADVARRRADSLTQVARNAQTVRDSAIAFSAALEARSAEADSLRATVVVQDSAIAHATARGDSLRLALTRSETRADRADSVLAAAVKVVRESEPPCRVLAVFRCPSRTTAVVGGVIVGSVVTMVVRNAVRHPPKFSPP